MDRILIAGTHPHEVAPPGGTYLNQVIDLAGLRAWQGFSLQGFVAFGYYIFKWEGVLSLVLFLVAATYQLRRWDNSNVVVNMAFLVPWFLFSLYWDTSSRYFSYLLPLVALMKGRWLGVMLGAMEQRFGVTACRVGAAMVIVVCAVPGLRWDYGRMPYEGAAEHIVSSQSMLHLSTNPAVGAASVNVGWCRSIPPTPRGVELARRDGFRFAVIDIMWPYYSDGFLGDLRSSIRWIEDKYPVVLESSYDRHAIARFVFEQHQPLGVARKRLAELLRNGVVLRVYDLSVPERRDSRARLSENK